MGNNIPEIIKLKSSCFLIKGSKGFVLVDTGVAGRTHVMLDALRANNASANDISLIVVTHTHFDHVGSLADIKKICNAPVLIHQAEQHELRLGKGLVPGSNMWLARQLIRLAMKLKASKTDFDPVEPDLVISDNFDLGGYGVDGIVIHTPGHTAGSISVVMDNGHCLVGDTMFNIFPGSIYPPFVNLPELVTQSWQRLIDTGCQYFHPAHGKAIHKLKLLKHLNSLREKELEK